MATEACEFTRCGSSSRKVVAITAVPEPGTLALLGIGLAGLLLARRRGRAC